MTKLRVSFLSLGFGVALLFVPSAHAQETCPDHFTETGVELGCPGRNVHQTVITTKQAKPAAASTEQRKRKATPVQMASAVADKNRPAAAGTSKR